MAKQRSSDREHTSDGNQESPEQRFAREAERKPPSIVREFCEFLWNEKKWWLLPIVIALLAIGLLITLSGTSVAPFIYTVF